MANAICDSIVYDTIMTFSGHFCGHTLPDKIRILNVSFLMPTMRRESGGCAGNIAFVLKMPDGEPIIMGTVGQDAGPYMGYLNKLGISTTHVTEVPDTSIMQVAITTDLGNNQIAAFHPGVMNRSSINSVKNVLSARFDLMGPDSCEGVLHYITQLVESGVPSILDLGQVMSLFDGTDLYHSVELISYVVINDYEAQVMLPCTGYSTTELVQRVETYIVTRGEEGMEIYTNGKQYTIPAVPAERVVGPISHSDVSRDGPLCGIENGLDWDTIDRLASLMGSLKIVRQGPQNHGLSVDEIARCLEFTFGYRCQ